MASVLTTDIELRLYEDKERLLVRKSLGDSSKTQAQSEDPDPLFLLRLRRFFNTMKGFHKVGITFRDNSLHTYSQTREN